jgi:hypothetical protein
MPIRCASAIIANPHAVSTITSSPHSSIRAGSRVSRASRCQKKKQKAKNMRRMFPTTEPVSRNSLDETFVSIVVDEKERPVLRAHTGPGTCYARSSNIPLPAGGPADRKHRPMIRIGCYQRVSVDYLVPTGNGWQCEAFLAEFACVWPSLRCFEH